MNPRRVMLALTLALIVSGVCTWIAAKKLEAPRAQPPKLPDARYVAPSHPLQAGVVLRPEDVAFVAWPRSHPLDGAFTVPAEAIGREVLFPLSKDEPILERDLSAPGSGIGLAGKIPDGMRAVALRSDEVVGVAGFLVPGSHLDVLVTYRSDRSPEPSTAIVLQDAVVLAAGQQIEPDPAGKTAPVTVVTLLLTPGESARAVLASTQGAIHFVLRNGSDVSRSDEPPVQLSQLSGDQPLRLPQRPSQTAPHTATTRAEPDTIETILGGTPPTASAGTTGGGPKP